MPTPARVGIIATLESIPDPMPVKMEACAALTLKVASFDCTAEVIAKKTPISSNFISVVRDRTKIMMIARIKKTVETPET